MVVFVCACVLNVCVLFEAHCVMLLLPFFLLGGVLLRVLVNVRVLCLWFYCLVLYGLCFGFVCSCVCIRVLFVIDCVMLDASCWCVFCACVCVYVGVV